MNNKLLLPRPSYLAKRKMRNVLINVFRFIFILGIAYIILDPILEKVAMSFMTQVDLYDKTVKYIPKHFTTQNYPEAVRFMDYWQSLLNTAFLAGFAAVLQAIACTFTGYGFACFKFKGRNLFFMLVIITMVIPPQLILTPLYLNFQNFKLFGLIPLFNDGKGLRLIESFIPFALLSATALGPRNGLYIFLARQMFKGLPREIDEAASIDGAGPFRIFFQVMLPSAIPIMTAIFLFSFVWQWNDSMYTFLFYTGFKTIAKVLTTLEQQFDMMTVQAGTTSSNIGYFSIMRSTGVLLAILPPLLLYTVFQKQFIQSIERSGIVG